MLSFYDDNITRKLDRNHDMTAYIKSFVYSQCVNRAIIEQWSLISIIVNGKWPKRYVFYEVASRSRE